VLEEANRRAVSACVTGHPAEKLPFVETLAPAESAPAVTTTAASSAGEGLDEYDDRTSVRRAGPDAGVDDGGPEGHRQADPAARAEGASASGGDAARGPVAVPVREALRCVVCGRALDFVRARPARRAGIRRAQPLLRGRRSGAYVARRPSRIARS